MEENIPINMGNASLYNANCFDIFPLIEDKSIDMILCDLPYNVTKHKDDISLPFDNLWNQYKRIIKDNGVIALFAQGLFYVDLINSNRKMFKYDLVWDKKLVTGFLNSNRMPLRVHEQIAIFYDQQPTYNPQMTYGEPSHSHGKAKGKQRKNENYSNFLTLDDTHLINSNKKHPISILSFPKPHPSIAKHRTEKSIPCLEWLVKTYTNEGDTVLDNTMGSGTTIIACENTKRKSIGIEIDKKYFDVTVKRLESLQDTLWTQK